MNNGDRLTCKIKRLEAGVLYVGINYVNRDVSIDWKKVARIESKQLFIIRTQDGSVFIGTLKSASKLDAEQPTELEITEKPEAGKPVSIKISRIVDVRQTAENSLKQMERKHKPWISLLQRQITQPNTTRISRRCTSRNAGPRRHI